MHPFSNERLEVVQNFPATSPRVDGCDFKTKLKAVLKPPHSPAKRDWRDGAGLRRVHRRFHSRLDAGRKAVIKHQEKLATCRGELYKAGENQYENEPYISRMDKKHGATGLGGWLESVDGLCLQFHGANKPTRSKATEAKGKEEQSAAVAGRRQTAQRFKHPGRLAGGRFQFQGLSNALPHAHRVRRCRT